MKQSFVLSHDLARSRALQAVKDAPEGYGVTISEPDRTIEQNSAQWPYLEGFSQQKDWPVNGERVKLTPDEWKDLLTAAFEGETSPRVALAWDGKGIVMLGRRTSKYGKKKFSEWYEWLVAAATVSGVTPVYKSPRREESESFGMVA